MKRKVKKFYRRVQHIHVNGLHLINDVNLDFQQIQNKANKLKKKTPNTSKS